MLFVAMALTIAVQSRDCKGAGLYEANTNNPLAKRSRLRWALQHRGDTPCGRARKWGVLDTYAQHYIEGDGECVARRISSSMIRRSNSSKRAGSVRIALGTRHLAALVEQLPPTLRARLEEIRANPNG
jgi:hypothetical protein